MTVSENLSETKPNSSRPEEFYKKGVLRNSTKFTEKRLCQSLFFNKVAGLRLKKATLAQVFSCELCEISKNTFSYRTPPVAAFELKQQVNSSTMCSTKLCEKR